MTLGGKRKNPPASVDAVEKHEEERGSNPNVAENVVEKEMQEDTNHSVINLSDSSEFETDVTSPTFDGNNHKDRSFEIENNDSAHTQVKVKKRKLTISDHKQTANIKFMLYLEEQVKIHEVTLRSWRQRRDVLLKEKEAAHDKKRELVEFRADLINRQASLEAARSKHLALQAELKQSLAMSREKLNRLTMLEDEEEERRLPKETGAGTQQFLEFPSSETQTPFETFHESSKEGVDNIEWKEQQTVPPNQPSVHSDAIKCQFPLVFDSYQSLKELLRYHEPENSQRRSLSRFLPYLEPSQVGDYLNIMLQEMHALDHFVDIGPPSASENKERSLRRQLFQNTCLDVLLFAENVAPGAYTDALAQPFDPNISLCPYELSGICADDDCPYQHTSKVTKVLARERLPLPSLPTSFLSGETVIERSKGANKNAKYETITSQIQAKQNIQCIPQSDHEMSTTDNEDDVIGGEDFILLPKSAHSGNSDNDKDGNGRNDDSVSHCEEKDIESVCSHNNITGTASSGSCSSLHHSVDDLQGLPPLATTSSISENCSEHTTNAQVIFWWGSNLSLRKSCRAKEAIPKAMKRSEVSILEILEEVFGLIIHEIPNTSKLEFSNERRLEITSMSLLASEGHVDKQPVDEIRLLGCLLDASRLALHGGLHDISITIYQELLGDKLLKDESLKGFAHLMNSQTEMARFYDHSAPSLSCFEVAFGAQVGVSIIAWSVSAYGEACEKQNGRNYHDVEKLKDGCKICCDLLKNPAPSVATNTLGIGLIQIENCLQKNSFNKILDAKIGNKAVSAQCESDHNEFDDVDISIATGKVDALRSFISWTQRDLIPLCDGLDDMLEQPLEEQLKSIWSVAKLFLQNYKQEKFQMKSDETSSTVIDDQLDWEFQCLKVIILMGYAIFRCLSNFARAVAAATRSGEKENGSHWSIAKLPASNLASWTLLDSVIAGVLKDMRILLVGYPLLDVVLAPLYASGIASTSYLRSYSTAQNRLLDYLSGNYCRSGYTRGHSSMNVLGYSELLWSQLVQLRMNLPNETPTLINRNRLLGKRDTADNFPWEPSTTLKEENNQFIAKLKSLDILLRHVVLWGDWMLSSLTRKNMSGETLLRAYSKTQDRSGCGSNYHDAPESLIPIVWKHNLKKLQVIKPKEDSNAKTSFLEEYSIGYQYPPPSPLPKLPLFFLHAGKFITSLDLRGCSLEKLPLTFGLHFPYLRKLDVSHNHLKELPESFRKLTHRMSFLENLCLRHNRLKSLPSDTLTPATSANAGSSSIKKSSSTSASSLRILDFSHNQLLSIPSLVGLNNLEVLELQNNALVDMTSADWSRLALRLPSLRILKRGNQVPSESLSREE